MSVDQSKSREPLLTLAMLGVLALTVGGAWMMVQYYYGFSREGAAIMREMRRRGLHDLWGRKNYAATFERREAGGEVTEQWVITRWSDGDSCNGLEQVKTVSETVDERWRLSDNLSDGNSKADHYSSDAGERTVLINLDHGRLSYSGSGMRTPQSMDAPANYIPEGADWLAIRMVAQAGKKASFQVLDDDLSLAEKTIVFFRLTVTPIDRQAVRCRIDSVAGGSDERVYRFDENGEVVRVEFEDGAVMTPTAGGGSSPGNAAPEGGGSGDPLVMAHHSFWEGRHDRLSWWHRFSNLCSAGDAQLEKLCHQTLKNCDAPRTTLVMAWSAAGR